jgi:hypothetical protein
MIDIRRHALSALALLALLAGSAAAATQAAPASRGRPMHFDPNLGQLPPRVSFLWQSTNQAVGVTDGGLEIALARDVGSAEELERKAPRSVSSRVTMDLVGARRSARAVGVDPLPSFTNSRLGSDPRLWRSHVPNFAGVRRDGIYPGIDLVLHGDQRALEYDFVVAADADPRAIRLRFSGTDGIDIDGHGDLVLRTPAGELRHQRPVAYQEVGGRRTPVAARFRRLPGGDFAFSLGGYDHRQRLVIDPVLQSTDTADEGNDSQAIKMVVDGRGNKFLAGVELGLGTAHDMFVFQFGGPDPSLFFSVGGQGDDRVTGLAVDANGRWVLVANTTSTNLITSRAFDSFHFGTNLQGYIQSQDRNGFLYASYFCGRSTSADPAGDQTFISDVVVRSPTEVWLTGSTQATQLAFTPNGFQRTNAGGYDAWVMKLDPTRDATTQVRYFSYFGGTRDEFGQALALVPSSRGSGVKVLGRTSSGDIHLVKSYGTPSRTSGLPDAFMWRSSGASFYEGAVGIGGSGAEIPTAISFDAAGNTYIAGQTTSTNYPTTTGAAQTAFAGGVADLFVTKLDFGDNNVLYSTYLGGSGYDSSPRMAVTSSGIVHLAATTDSVNFPVSAGAPQPSYGGGTSDAVVVKLNARGRRAYSTFLGGPDKDTAAGILTIGSAVLVLSNNASPAFPNGNGYVNTYSPQALLVVGTATLDAGDTAIGNRLQALGFSVVVKTGVEVTAADAAGKDLVVVSATITSTQVNTKLKASETPVIMLENGLQDDMAMTGTATDQFGNAANQGILTMITSTDVLSAGQSGSPAVTTPGRAFTWGKPGANAVAVASLASDATRIAIYRYEAGVAMVGGFVAPDRRVGFFAGDEPSIATDDAAANLTTSGTALFEAAVRWAAGQ